MVAEEYNRLVYEATGWRGAYPLVIPIRVGDYFEMGAQGIPIQLGNAFNWPGWSQAVPVDHEEINGSETYYAGCQRETTVSAGGGVTVPGGVGAEATLSLSFTHAAGFVLAHDAATRSHVRDVVAVQQSILQSARVGWWQESWILVTEVIEAKSATLAVTTESGSKIELHANAQIPTGIAGVGIADPTLGWTASSWRGSGYSSICKPGTPLYHCVKVRESVFGRLSSELLGDEDIAEVFTDDPHDASS